MKMSNFQLILLVVFGFFILLGVGVFAAFGGLLGGKSVGTVVMWGTLDSNEMDDILTTMRQSDKTFASVRYVQKDPATYDSDLLDAMASGSGPDLFMVSQDELTPFANKITTIPYSMYSQAQYTNSFIDEGQLFLTPQGILALPLMVDPMVMYWNRDLFASAGVAQAPQYWNDFITIAPKLTSLDANSTVQKSAVALGTWKNVDHAKQILSTLFMQAGDPIVVRDSTGRPMPVLGQTPTNATANPAESALRFYTEFANPSKTTYSWNNGLPESSQAFVAGKVGAYFGFASEYAQIAARNPNLSYAVAMVPQLQGNTAKVTFGQMTGVAVSRTAPNPQGALLVAEHLTSQAGISALATKIFLPPVRRDVQVDTSANAASSVFVQSALIAHAWLDPSPNQSDAVFQDMIESVLSGTNLPAGAVAQGAQELNQVFTKQP